MFAKLGLDQAVNNLPGSNKETQKRVQNVDSGTSKKRKADSVPQARRSERRMCTASASQSGPTSTYANARRHFLKRHGDDYRVVSEDDDSVPGVSFDNLHDVLDSFEFEDLDLGEPVIGTDVPDAAVDVCTPQPESLGFKPGMFDRLQLIIAIRRRWSERRGLGRIVNDYFVVSVRTPHHLRKGIRGGRS